MPATPKDWSTGTDAPTEACSTRLFTAGDALEWTPHSVPGYVTAVTVTNLGAGTLYVAAGPALSGTATAAQNAHRLSAGQGKLLNFSGQSPTPQARTKFSTWGADGAAHPVGLIFESVP